jgi:hypothetical protein
VLLLCKDSAATEDAEEEDEGDEDEDEEGGATGVDEQPTRLLRSSAVRRPLRGEGFMGGEVGMMAASAEHRR